MTKKQGPAPHAWTNKEVATVLERIGTMMDLAGENPFKSRAYFNAARTLQTEERSVTDLVAAGELGSLKGFGVAITEKVTSLVTTGHIPYLDELREQVPESLLDLLELPKMGPKKVKAVWDELGITTVGELEYACEENRLVDLPGFGAKTQASILEGIEYFKRNVGLSLINEALPTARAALEFLLDLKTVKRGEIAGSIRRRKEVVGDADLLVSSASPDAVMKAFVKMAGVEGVIAHGETKSSVRMTSGLQIDLRVVTDAEFPFALHHFTGSKEHNVAMRARAKARDMKLNEYGLFKGEKEKLVPCATEDDIFEALGLAPIAPEMREDMGEIEAAERRALPHLIERGDIRGIFHNHSTWSDGRASLRDMALAAKKRGYEYFGISDHSRSAGYAHGLEIERIEAQHAEVDALNAELVGIKILKGIESDILPDGSLDYPDKVLRTFDFVIASVHSSMKQDRETMTERVLRAMDNPHVRILGHPTGRLLLAREAFAIDMEAVMRHAAETGVALEINANPHRLDVDWRFLKRGKELGVKFAISPDAHAIEGLDDTDWGVGIARKGWLEKGDVVNTERLSRVLDQWK
ncbi:MAG: DNA polymerase/3'-5' exonuclease PolX [Myxococcales bacterium]|nr:DNA polymerase/3'-5' exonuclease PolX [Myxococcales bacterium]